MNGNKGKLNIIKKRFFELEGTEIETFQIETQRGKNGGEHRGQQHTKVTVALMVVTNL